MVIDIVATRDIIPDEEIFIDYGKNWEEAWTEHVKKFRSEPHCENGSIGSKRVHAMNRDKFNSSYHEWTDSHFSVCFQDDQSLVSTVYVVAANAEVSDSDKANFNLTSDYEGITTEHEGFNLTRDDSERLPCLIKASSQNSSAFDVIIFMDWSIPHELRYAEMIRIFEGFPPGNIEFIPKPWKSDLHWAGAFRHPIAMPDHVFPPHWMAG